MAALGQFEASTEQKASLQFYINQKGQLIKFVNMVRNGREVQMQEIKAFDIT